MLEGWLNSGDLRFGETLQEKWPVRNEEEMIVFAELTLESMFGVSRLVGAAAGLTEANAGWSDVSY